MTKLFCWLALSGLLSPVFAEEGVSENTTVNEEFSEPQPATDSTAPEQPPEEPQTNEAMQTEFSE